MTTIEPTGYLVTTVNDADPRLLLAKDMATDMPAGCEVTPLYPRDAIAPLKVPVVDQNNRHCGWEHRTPAQILEVVAYADDSGTIWTPPTAWAYYAVCKARNDWQERAERAERLLAQIVDGQQAITYAKSLLARQLGVTNDDG